MGRVLIVTNLVFASLGGCLLLADPPRISDRCVDQELGDELGENLATARTGTSDSTYDCPERAEDVPDVVFEWTAPAAGTYEFSAVGADIDLRLGLAMPTCGGEALDCTAYDEPAIRYTAYDGETLHVLVQLDGWDDGGFVLSIVEVDRLPTTDDDDSSGEGPMVDCSSIDNGVCDEPEGSGLCPEGTDTVDCACPFRQDGYCDEPDVCPSGSDPEDCTCSWEGDGECDEPEGTGYCTEGSDPLDC